MKRVFLTTISILIYIISVAQTPVSWNFETKDNKDGTFDLIFKASIEAPWYIYSSQKIDNGPMPASFDIQPAETFETIGQLKDGAETHKKFDKAFSMDVLIFEQEGVYVQTIKPLTSGSIKVQGVLNYQSCNGHECIIDEIDVSFDIKNTQPQTPAESSPGSTTPSEPKDQGLMMFILIAFAAGLGGVFTPCVFPMIPMTVSFFIGGQSKSSGAIKGIIFGLSVTLIYTAIGLLVALFKTTDATDVMGTHWLPNLIFGVLFILFAISFLGAFEITLPGGLANKADSKADKGGFIAAFFVAFAMVIVSFSCTGPFVGSILAAAVSGGVALRPIIGMFVFGFAFSLPFVIFSFFPSLMKKMPKSGGWLNVVKVVFAFVLLAFALKYLAIVDSHFGIGILSRATFISLWIGISLALSLYLFGFFRTHHDSPSDGLGWGRIIFATISLSFALYLVPGLFGAPLASLSAIIPPQDGSTLTIGSATTQQIKTTADFIPEGLCGPAKYGDEKHIPPYGLKAYYDIESAIECSKQLNKPILLSFKSLTCSACKLMEANVWSDPKVLEILKNEVILANLYVDNKSELPQEEWITSTLDGKVKKSLGRKLRDYQLSRFNVASQPYYVLIDENENILTPPVGESSVEEYLAFLNNGIDKYKNR